MTLPDILLFFRAISVFPQKPLLANEREKHSSRFWRTRNNRPVPMGLLFLVLFASAGVAQERINRVGMFKIGMSRDSLIAAAKELSGMDARTVQTQDDFVTAKTIGSNSGILFLRLMPDRAKPLEAPEHCSFCPRTEIFYLSKYTVSELDFKEVFLTVYRNRLIEFASDAGNPIQEALQETYGAPEYSSRNYRQPCRTAAPDKDDTDFAITTEKFYQIWSDGDNEVIISYGYEISDDCTSHWVMNLSVQDAEAMDEEDNCDQTFDNGSIDQPERLGTQLRGNRQ